MNIILFLILINFIFSTKVIEYSVSFYQIPMANVILEFETENVINENEVALKFETKTNRFASKIFKVNNTYKTLIKKDSYDIVHFSKKTSQPGLYNDLKTYLLNDKTIYENSKIEIPKNYFNIFSLLYYLSITPYDLVDSSIKLEREGLLYICNIEKYETKNENIYTLYFEIIENNNKPIIENTDMFTWAIFKEGSLKEIRVDKVLKEINSCKFSTGISTLKANKK